MNPILLKPESNMGSQVIVQGKRLTTVKARDYAALKPSLMAPVLDSFARLRQTHDLVIVEGAGSPAEINLRAGDIANMGFAVAANVPVILCADIDRGGVIAQVVGTQAVLEPTDAGRIAGFLVNKFRGDPRLFDDGYQMIRDQTGWPGFGVLPWFDQAWRLPAEDALDIRTQERSGGFHVVCLRLSRIANFDDLDPLEQEPGLRLTMLDAGRPIPGDVILDLPGSKSPGPTSPFAQSGLTSICRPPSPGRTCLDLRRLSDARPCHRRPQGIEAGGASEGWASDVETTMTGDKSHAGQRRHVASGTPFRAMRSISGARQGRMQSGPSPG